MVLDAFVKDAEGAKNCKKVLPKLHEILVLSEQIQQEAVPHAVGENEVGAAEPDVRAGIGLFGAHPVVDVLRTHVEPAHVHFRMPGLVRLLDQGQEVSTVRRVQDDRRARVPAAGGDRGERHDRPDSMERRASESQGRFRRGS